MQFFLLLSMIFFVLIRILKIFSSHHLCIKLCRIQKCKIYWYKATTAWVIGLGPTFSCTWPQCAPPHLLTFSRDAHTHTPILSQWLWLLRPCVQCRQTQACCLHRPKWKCLYTTPHKKKIRLWKVNLFSVQYYAALHTLHVLIQYTVQ